MYIQALKNSIQLTFSGALCSLKNNNKYSCCWKDVTINLFAYLSSVQLQATLTLVGRERRICCLCVRANKQCRSPTTPLSKAFQGWQPHSDEFWFRNGFPIREKDAMPTKSERVPHAYMYAWLAREWQTYRALPTFKNSWKWKSHATPITILLSYLPCEATVQLRA